MSKNVCEGCWMLDRFGKCHYVKGEYCKATKSK